jgi:hypothetical protein
LRTLYQTENISIDLSARFEDERGVVYAEVTKTLFVADKEHYRSLKLRK